jgi:hypothetical protein
MAEIRCLSNGSRFRAEFDETAADEDRALRSTRLTSGSFGNPSSGRAGRNPSGRPLMVATVTAMPAIAAACCAVIEADVDTMA